MNLAVFASTYDAAKAADARYVVGSDLRITPSVLSGQPHPPELAARYEVPGVADVAPVVFQLQNGVLIGPYDQDRADVAAVDPTRFAHVAALSDSFFLDGSAAEAMRALAANPHGVLVRADLADELSVENGDDVQVLLARGTEHQTVAPFHVVGRFDRMAGFPQGVSLIVPLSTYQSATGLDQVDFFLARTNHADAGSVRRVAAALQAGPGRDDPLVIATTRTALDKDQSSLTALDVNGLVDLNLLATLLMSVACVGLFVFGLLLARRREYVTLRAQGLAAGRLRRLVLAEAGVVAVGGLLVGAVVGLGDGPAVRARPPAAVRARPAGDRGQREAPPPAGPPGPRRGGLCASRRRSCSVGCARPSCSASSSPRTSFPGRVAGTVRSGPSRPTAMSEVGG